MILLPVAKPVQKPQTTMHNASQIASLTREFDGHTCEICALALTSDIALVWVNAFELIAFCRFVFSHMPAVMVILTLQVVPGFEIRKVADVAKEVRQ